MLQPLIEAIREHKPHRRRRSAIEDFDLELSGGAHGRARRPGDAKFHLAFADRGGHAIARLKPIGADGGGAILQGARLRYAVIDFDQACRVGSDVAQRHSCAGRNIGGGVAVDEGQARAGRIGEHHIARRRAAAIADLDLIGEQRAHAAERGPASAKRELRGGPGGRGRAGAERKAPPARAAIGRANDLDRDLIRTRDRAFFE